MQRPKQNPLRWRVIDHGRDAPDYFPGHGLFGNRFEDCATGVGDTRIEALSDALDALASNGWDLNDPQIETTLRGELDLVDVDLHAHCDSRRAGHAEECEIRFFVSVDVSGRD